MANLAKIPLYARTVAHLKPSQVTARIIRKLGGRTMLKRGFIPSPEPAASRLESIALLPELDFDPQFLSRFDVEGIMQDRICLLHHSEDIDWLSCWNKNLHSPLWMFNLHYFEYLLPLAKAYLDTSDDSYLLKGKSIIESWIENCPPDAGGSAWDPYTISMRCVNWLAFCGETELAQLDPRFMTRVSTSLLEQYQCLSTHLETDLLANHYFEDLKALAILACYFDDSETLDLVLPKLTEQIKEQVLPDGMHFELSPMYHKIILEDMMRLAKTLQNSACLAAESIDYRLQDMVDVLYSLERHTDRTPLFNDSGDNVAKGRDALLACAQAHFEIEPHFKNVLPDAGYCIIERQTESGLVKVVFDAGNPGPTFAMGHVHCDALSFECFVDGKPWIVNCGTYAYQDPSRLTYKETLSHSTVAIKNREQHECWASFRVARHGFCRLVDFGHTSATGLFNYADDKGILRLISVGSDSLLIEDTADTITCELVSALHFADLDNAITGTKRHSLAYSPEFGIKSDCSTLVYSGVGRNLISVPYPGQTRKEIEL